MDVYNIEPKPPEMFSYLPTVSTGWCLNSLLAKMISTEIYMNK